MEPDLPTQLATLSGLAAPLIVSALRRYLAGKPKWMLPFLCAAIAVGISVVSQLGAAAATGDDPSGWGMLFGVAMGGLGLLGRQMLHEAGSGETISPPAPKPPTGPHLGPPPRRHGRLSGLALAVLLLAGPAAAQEVSEPRPCSWGEFCPAHVSTEATPAACTEEASLETAETFPVATPGMSTWWCSDRICSGTGTSRISRAVPQSPPDPWAGGGRFTPSSPASLAAWRARYSYPFTVAGSYVGAWCGQHGPCDALLSEWLARFGSRTWTAGGACLEAGDLGRAACDAIHTGGATLGCVMLPCGIVSCPSSPRTCSVDGTCGGGWRCTPLLELPEGERIGAVTPQGRTVRARRDTTSGSSDACSFFAGAQGVLWVRQFSPCFAGMSADCRTVTSLRPECWAPPEPPPPVCGDGTCEPGEVCPEDCDPPTLPVFALLDCGPVGWRLQAPGGEILPVAPGGEVELEVAGRFRLRVPEQCLAGDCPSAGVLAVVRAVPGVCP